MDYNGPLKTQVSRTSAIKTNFSHFTKKDLFFVEGKGAGEEGKLLKRELGASVKVEVAGKDATSLPDPPPMPLYASEVMFAFDYGV